MRRSLGPVLAFVMFAGSVAFGERIVVDVGAWGDTGNGCTADGWQVGGLSLYSGTRHAKFDAKDDYANSPRYDAVVTQVVVTASATETSTRPLVLTPIGGKGDPETHELAFTTELQSQVFSWAPECEVRQFNVVESWLGSGNGYWKVAALEVYLKKIECPTSLSTTSEWRDSFDVTWNGDPGACRHEVELEQIVTVPERGDVVRTWDFSVLENGKGSNVAWGKAEIPSGLSDVTGEDLWLPTGRVGVVQVGKDNVSGTLRLPVAESVRPLVFRLEASRYAKDDADGNGTVQYLDAAGATNRQETIWLTKERETYVKAVPADARTIEVVSLKARRIWVAKAELLADFTPTAVTTNVWPSVETRHDGYSFRDLEGNEWRWRVRSFDEAGVASPWSAFESVSLDASAPGRIPRGLYLLLR